MKVRDIKENILLSNNKKLTEWINVNFSIGNSVGESLNHFNTLKQLDKKIVIFAIARMEQIEASYDTSKYIAFFISIIVFCYSIYTVFLPEKFVILLILPTLFYVLSNWKKERKIYQTAVYFKNLMIGIKEYQKEN